MPTITNFGGSGGSSELTYTTLINAGSTYWGSSGNYVYTLADDYDCLIAIVECGGYVSGQSGSSYAGSRTISYSDSSKLTSITNSEGNASSSVAYRSGLTVARIVDAKVGEKVTFGKNQWGDVNQRFTLIGINSK